MNLEQWIDTDLGKQIWHRKYQVGEETFDEWLDRVSNRNEQVKQLIKERKFLFGGRILASRGVTDRKVTYSNCYVLPQVGDSIEIKIVSMCRILRNAMKDRDVIVVTSNYI